MTTADWIRDAVARRQGDADRSPAWRQALRTRALERFMAEGWPTSRLENWRHTSLAVLDQQAFTDIPQNDAQAARSAVALRGTDAGHWLVFVNGRFVPDASHIGALPAGATVCSVAQALHDQRLSDELYGSESLGSSVVALNAALSTDGAYVHLNDGVSLDAPVHCVFVNTGAQALNVPRNIISLQGGAQATVVEHYVGHGDGAGLTAAVTRGHIASRAQLTHVKLQQESEQAWHLGWLDIRQDQGSVFNSHSMSFGAKLARHDITTAFADPHCETLLNGLYYVNGRRHVDHHTTIGHHHPHGISREYYRGILDDNARGVFAGRIHVAPGADKTDAVQRSDSLLLSRLARADARPELEIYADDVKCAHGATVGQMDEDSLFYLRSRGLDQQHARHVLTYAFAAEAIERIADASLRARVIAAIGNLAPQGIQEAVA